MYDHRENWLICKGHFCDFVKEYESRTDFAMKINMHIILFMYAVWLQTHPCLKGNLKRDFGMCILLASVVASHTFIYIVCTCCKIHVYLACISTHLLLVASHSLFFNVNVVTLLLGEYTLFARANLCYPTTNLHSYFSTLFAAQIRVYARKMASMRSFKPFLHPILCACVSWLQEKS